jgi:nicotinamide riboside kinase
MLLTDDPVLLGCMSAASSPYSKVAWYDGDKLDPDLNNSISEKDEQKHNEMRAKVANGVSKCDFWRHLTFADICHKYAGKDNPNIESSIDDRVLDLIHHIENHYLSINGIYRVMDFARVAQYFAWMLLQMSPSQGLWDI